jgi:hypothetical protein
MKASGLKHTNWSAMASENSGRGLYTPTRGFTPEVARLRTQVLGTITQGKELLEELFFLEDLTLKSKIT